MHHPTTKQAGQAIIILIAMIFALAMTIFWFLDLHTLIYKKVYLQDAVDASSLSAARWQALGINLVGELNLMQALALTQSNDQATCAAINQLQGRLCFTTPIFAYAAAQYAAEKNGIPSQPYFEKLLHSYTRRIEHTCVPGTSLYDNAPYPGIWQDFARTMRKAVSQYGARALPLSKGLYNIPFANHLLTNPDLYRAIRRNDYCWFYFNAYQFLANYAGPTSWPPLPEIVFQDPHNPALYSLHLTPQTHTLRTLTPRETIDPILQDHGFPATPNPEAIVPDPNDPDNTISTYDLPITWFLYNPTIWQEWFKIKQDGFPIRSEIKPQFDYAGADASCLIHDKYSRPSKDTTPESDHHPADNDTTQTIVATAAAKPFGAITQTSPNTIDNDVAPTTYSLVIPAFSDVRIIPMGVSDSEMPDLDYQWIIHVTEHLPHYLKTHSFTDTTCTYCKALIKLDTTPFKTIAIDWLKDNSRLCRRPPTGTGPGPGSGHGGTPIGH